MRGAITTKTVFSPQKETIIGLVHAPTLKQYNLFSIHCCESTKKVICFQHVEDSIGSRKAHREAVKSNLPRVGNGDRAFPITARMTTTPQPPAFRLTSAPKIEGKQAGAKQHLVRK